MKNLKFKNARPPFVRWDDVARIVNVCEKSGYRISPNNAQRAWELYSETYAAAWLIVPDDDQHLLEAILEVMEPE